MHTHERISLIREQLCDGSTTTLAEKLSMSPQQASQLCSGARNAGQRMCERISAAFPSISRSWLILGEGPMFCQASNHTTQQPKRRQRPIPDTVEACHDEIRLLRELVDSKDVIISEQSSTISDLRNFVSVLMQLKSPKIPKP